MASRHRWLRRVDLAAVVDGHAAVGEHAGRKSNTASNGGKCMNGAPNGGDGTLPGGRNLYPSATGQAPKRERRCGGPPTRLVLAKWWVPYCWQLCSAPPRATGRGGGASAAPRPGGGGSLETGRAGAAAATHRGHHRPPWPCQDPWQGVLLGRTGWNVSGWRSPAVADCGPRLGEGAVERGTGGSARPARGGYVLAHLGSHLGAHPCHLIDTSRDLFRYLKYF